MKKQNTKRYIVLSPDGFPIERDKTYNSKAEARKALKLWVTRYDLQGYYSTSDRSRIPLHLLPVFCVIKEL